VGRLQVTTRVNLCRVIVNRYFHAREFSCVSSWVERAIRTQAARVSTRARLGEVSGSLCWNYGKTSVNGDLARAIFLERSPALLRAVAAWRIASGAAVTPG
jgi:hypothetical protein